MPHARGGPYKKTGVTRERIVDAAMTIFAANGYRNGSTTRIAELAGISVAQIYYHFPTKEAAVLDAVLERRDSASDEVARPAPGDPGDIPLAMLRIAANNETVPEHIALYTPLVAASTVPGHPANAYFRNRYRRLRTRFESAFSEMERAGLFRPGIDAAYAATSTLALWDGIQVQWLTEPAAVDVVRILRRHLATITTVIPLDAEAHDGPAGRDFPD